MHPNLIRGAAGEDTAAAWYRAHGFEVLERNWRTPEGEIDLICARPDLLVICEVKSRRTDRHGDPAEAVTRSKQVRLRRLATAYLGRSARRYAEVRFDVASVLGATLTVIEDAF
ncbi:MAG TPA: YraN family protein [Acidimicrobiales bacterium]